MSHTVGCKELSDWSESCPLYSLLRAHFRRHIAQCFRKLTVLVLVPGRFAWSVCNLKMSSISRILRDIASEMERRAETVSSTEELSSSSVPSRHPVDAEVCRIFASYGNRVPGNPSIAARRRSTYTRAYFCLSKIDQTIAPTREEKEFLSAAGLGEQRITFFGDEGSAEEFRSHILVAYPKLNGCGGFELLKVSGLTRSKKLSVIPCPRTGYTIKSVRIHIKHSLIYIRPMQKNIDTTPVEHQTGGYGPKEKCLTCSEEFFFSELKDHVKHCKSPNEIDTALPEICHPVSPEFPFPTSPDRDNSSSDTGIIDLTDDQVPESLEEWRAMRSQQDQEYQDCLLADQEKSDLQKKSAEMEERRIKAISERQLRLIGVPEQAHGIPLRFKYPSGITRTRRFVLTESIQILFDFVGEDEDATEYFHIQDALSVTRLNSNMSGTFLDNNIIRSQTLYVHWIQPESPEFVPALDYNNHEVAPSFNNMSCSPLTDSPPAHGRSFSPKRADLKTILNGLWAKIDNTSCPTSNQINICRDYTGNVHNIMKSTLQAFRRRRFNPAARLDVVFVDSEKTSEGAVDGGGPTREYLRLLMKAIHQSNIFEGPEKDKRLTLDTHALEGKLYTQIARMISVCVIHGGVAPNFFSDRLFNQICGKPSLPATLEEVGDFTFKEKLLEIKNATTVEDAKAAIEKAEDSLAIVGAWRNITTLRQRDALVQSAVDFFVEGRLNVALQQWRMCTCDLGECPGICFWILFNTPKWLSYAAHNRDSSRGFWQDFS
ncbi:uncharacterized protein LOC102079890 isoform X2 [Oreochromis niloticus]|nr:uncharacterized protein LOC102079890 isoform X2 [Oreochromis niloticus]